MQFHVQDMTCGSCVRHINEAIGKAKEAIGEHNRDPNLAAEGEAQQAEGKGQQMKGKVKGALGDDI